MTRFGFRMVLPAVLLLAFCDLDAQTPGSPDQTTPDQSSAAPAPALIDINRASAEELKTLPGIQDAWAAAIIRNRPYKNKTQLTTRHIIPPAAYKRIRRLIIAKQ